MNAETLLDNFNTRHTFSQDETLAIHSEGILRTDLVNYFRRHRNRPFALTLLNRFIELRKEKNGTTIEDLMLASFLLGMHGQVEDSLKVWEAKRIDFDTYCGVDIQLVPFAGVDQTIAYLQTQSGSDAKDALEYVSSCAKSGDFDDLEKYYNESPWWL